MTLTESQLARLPKAAREEIERLQGSVAYWQQQAHPTIEGSNTWIRRYTGAVDEQRAELGDSPSVIFDGELGQIEVRVEGDVVSVRAADGSPLVVRPRSDNTIEVLGMDKVAEILDTRARREHRQNRKG